MLEDFADGDGGEARVEGLARLEVGRVVEDAEDRRVEVTAPPESWMSRRTAVAVKGLVMLAMRKRSVGWTWVWATVSDHP